MRFPTLTRRTFLKAAIAGGGVVLLGGGGLLGLRGSAPRVEGLRALSEQEHRTLSQLARATFPEGGPFAAGAEGADLARVFDGFLADEPEWNRRDLKDALGLLEFGPVVYEGRLKTFSHLSAEERLAHFQRWRESDDLLRRQVATALTKFLCLVFYDRPEAWPALGYDGPMIKPG